MRSKLVAILLAAVMLCVVPILLPHVIAGTACAEPAASDTDLPDPGPGEDPQHPAEDPENPEEDPEDPNKPGKRPGWHGSRRPGGFGGLGGLDEVETGLRVTPGKALSKNHVMGTGNDQRYNTVTLVAAAAPSETLVLGGETLRLTASVPFTALIEGGTLTLVAEEEASWRVNLAVLETLRESGITAVRLTAPVGDCEFDTALEFTGRTYGELRRLGYVPQDFILCAAAGQVSVMLEDTVYALQGSELLVQ